MIPYTDGSISISTSSEEPQPPNTPTSPKDSSKTYNPITLSLNTQTINTTVNPKTVKPF